MLTAKVGNGIINSFEYLESDIRKWSDKGIIKCPYCNGQMLFRNGKIKVAHFAHKHKCSVEYNYYEPETNEHLAGKKALYEWLRQQDNIKNLKMEAWIPETKQRPDIYFEQNGKRFVIEFQCSPISSQYLERRKLYELAGITDVWILGTEKYQNTHKFIERSSNFYFNASNSMLKINSNYIWNILEEKLFKKYKLDLFYTFNLQDIVFDNCIKLSKNAKKPFIIMNNNQKIKKNMDLQDKIQKESLKINIRNKRIWLNNFVKTNMQYFSHLLHTDDLFYDIYINIDYCHFILYVSIGIFGCTEKEFCVKDDYYNRIVTEINKFKVKRLKNK